jgi:hypothetical protein
MQDIVKLILSFFLHHPSQYLKIIFKKKFYISGKLNNFLVGLRETHARADHKVQVTKQISEFCYVFDTKYERNQKHRQVHCV